MIVYVVQCDECGAVPPEVAEDLIQGRRPGAVTAAEARDIAKPAGFARVYVHRPDGARVLRDLCWRCKP